MRTLYLDVKLDKQLQALSRAGKKAALAAGQARDIVQKLKSGRLCRGNAGTVTRHGESRIKGCIKYDLGSGYRLVTFRQGEDLLLLFAGNHDDCHRWIENNREIPIDRIKGRSKVIPVETDSPEGRLYEDDDRGGADPQGAEDVSDRLDDSQLRIIFSGLVGCNEPAASHPDQSS